jgi:hypothetical protein
MHLSPRQWYFRDRPNFHEDACAVSGVAPPRSIPSPRRRSCRDRPGLRAGTGASRFPTAAERRIGQGAGQMRLDRWGGQKGRNAWPTGAMPQEPRPWSAAGLAVPRRCGAVMRVRGAASRPPERAAEWPAVRSEPAARRNARVGRTARSISPGSPARPTCNETFPFFPAGRARSCARRAPAWRHRQYRHRFQCGRTGRPRPPAIRHRARTACRGPAPPATMPSPLFIPPGARTCCLAATSRLCSWHSPVPPGRVLRGAGPRGRIVFSPENRTGR